MDKQILKFVLKRMGLGFLLIAGLFLALFFFPVFTFQVMLLILVLTISFLIGAAILGYGDR